MAKKKKEKIGGYIQIFISSQFGNVRVIEKDNYPWFVAIDICKALTIQNHKDAISRLHSNEKDEVGIPDPIGRIQKTYIINEPGLYRLIHTSRKPEAIKFQDWVYHEVLPSIRATGGYVDPNHDAIRFLSKEIRKYETSAIRKLIDYGKKTRTLVSDRPFNELYKIITAKVNKICGIPSGERDIVSTQQLITCIGAEACIEYVINWGIEKEFTFIEICDALSSYATYFVDRLKNLIPDSMNNPIAINGEKLQVIASEEPTRLVLKVNGVNYNVEKKNFAA